MTLLSPSVQLCQEVPPGRAPHPRPPCWSPEQSHQDKTVQARARRVHRGARKQWGRHPFRAAPRSQASPARPGRVQSPPWGPGMPAGREGLPCPSTYRGAKCCCSNGGIRDEWGKLFLPLSRLQKETKNPFTSANNALMWAPAPAARTGLALCKPPTAGLWGRSQWRPLPVGDPGRFRRQAGEGRPGHHA